MGGDSKTSNSTGGQGGRTRVAAGNAAVTDDAGPPARLVGDNKTSNCRDGRGRRTRVAAGNVALTDDAWPPAGVVYISPGCRGSKVILQQCLEAWAAIQALHRLAARQPLHSKPLHSGAVCPPLHSQPLHRLVVCTPLHGKPLHSGVVCTPLHSEPLHSEAVNPLEAVQLSLSCRLCLRVIQLCVSALIHKIILDIVCDGAGRKHMEALRSGWGGKPVGSMQCPAGWRRSAQTRLQRALVLLGNAPRSIGLQQGLGGRQQLGIRAGAWHLDPAALSCLVPCACPCVRTRSQKRQFQLYHAHAEWSGSSTTNRQGGSSPMWMEATRDSTTLTESKNNEPAAAMDTGVC